MPPHKSKLFKLIDTPYITNLKLAIDRALNRPVTVHNKQRYLVNVTIEFFKFDARIGILYYFNF